MKNCRYSYGGVVPGVVGMQDFGQGQYGFGGQQLTPEALAQMAGQVPGGQPQAPQQQRRGTGFDKQGFMNAAALGALAGLGGKGGTIAAPIMAILAQLMKGKKMGIPTTARTPSFVDDGRYGG